MDAYVGGQFNNELPKPVKKTDTSILVTSSLHSDPENNLCHAKRILENVLPLILYWSYDYRHTCTLNPAIGAQLFPKSHLPAGK